MGNFTVVGAQGTLTMNDGEKITTVMKSRMRVYDTVYSTLKKSGYEENRNGSMRVYPVSENTVVMDCKSVDMDDYRSFAIFYDLEKNVIVYVHVIPEEYGKITDVLITDKYVTALYDVSQEYNRWFSTELFVIGDDTISPVAGSFNILAKSYYSSAKLIGRESILYRGYNKDSIVRLPQGDVLIGCDSDFIIRVTHDEHGETYMGVNRNQYVVFDKTGDDTWLDFDYPAAENRYCFLLANGSETDIVVVDPVVGTVHSNLYNETYDRLLYPIEDQTCTQYWDDEEGENGYRDDPFVEKITAVIPGKTGLYVIYGNTDPDVKYYEFDVELGETPHVTVSSRYSIGSGGKYAVTDANGYPVTEYLFDKVERYGNLRVVCMNEKYGVYDTYGNRLHDCVYDGRSECNKLLHLYCFGNNVGNVVSQETGKIIVKGKCATYYSFANNVIAGRADGRYGMYGPNGESLTRPVYAVGVILNSKGVWITEKNGKMYVFRIDGTCLPFTDFHRLELNGRYGNVCYIITVDTFVDGRSTIDTFVWYNYIIHTVTTHEALKRRICEYVTDSDYVYGKICEKLTSLGL